PYAFGIYFAYFCPFIMLAALSFVSAPRTPLRGMHACALSFYLLFALVWVNTGSIRTIGVLHRPEQNTERLLPEGAGLRVTPDTAGGGYGARGGNTGQRGGG